MPFWTIFWLIVPAVALLAISYLTFRHGTHFPSDDD